MKTSSAWLEWFAALLAARIRSRRRASLALCYNSVYTMVFAWDENKDRINRRKHGVSFEAAARIFEDPNAVSYVDRVVDGEERWHTIGLAGGVVILLVVHTIEEQHGEEEIRIISARKASSRERTLYESHQ